MLVDVGDIKTYRLAFPKLEICISSNIEAVRPPFLWWSVVECGGVWWSVVECGGVWWSVVECGGVWWSVVECGGGGGCGGVRRSNDVSHH